MEQRKRTALLSGFVYMYSYCEEKQARKAGLHHRRMMRNPEAWEVKTHGQDFKGHRGYWYWELSCGPLSVLMHQCDNGTIRYVVRRPSTQIYTERKCKTPQAAVDAYVKDAREYFEAVIDSAENEIMKLEQLK